MLAVMTAQRKAGCDVCRVGPLAPTAKQAAIEILREIIPATAREGTRSEWDDLGCGDNGGSWDRDDVQGFARLMSDGKR